ncbi:hypothetical protein CYMTET_48319 [Cymbomonas tetramitiformis]|uniref:CCHC-type domain-containing protein n=1 Tax=Cymbomonas tetramitiformis TaxID=36881 RepID=A0AAE0EVQ6_9CHLO|nr:hypothetical protein CYMTET_48319 [Cymbomonas tetramitiformis]
MGVICNLLSPEQNSYSAPMNLHPGAPGSVPVAGLPYGTIFPPMNPYGAPPQLYSHSAFPAVPLGADSARNLLPQHVQGALCAGIGASGVAAVPALGSGALSPQLEVLYQQQQLQQLQQQHLARQYELNVLHQQLQLQPRQLHTDFAQHTQSDEEFPELPRSEERSRRAAELLATTFSGEHQDWSQRCQTQLKRTEALTAEVQSRLKSGALSIRKLREQQDQQPKYLPVKEAVPSVSASGTAPCQPTKQKTALSGSVSGTSSKQQPSKKAVSSAVSSSEAALNVVSGGAPALTSTVSVDVPAEGAARAPAHTTAKETASGAVSNRQSKKAASSDSASKQWLSEEAVLFRIHSSMGKHRKARVVRWEENLDQLWSDHSGESAGSPTSSPVRLQLVVASSSERESLRRWFQKEPRTRHGSLKWYLATADQLRILKAQVSPQEYRRMLRHGALRHEGGVPVKHFAGVNFGQARKLEKDEYPVQHNNFAALSDLQSQELSPPPGFPAKPRYPARSSSEDSTSSGSSQPSSSSGSGSSDEGGSEGRSRGRRRYKKKKPKKPKKQKQRKSKKVDKGKAAVVEEDFEMASELAVQTLFKDKALRDQAFECLPEERQQAIARAMARGEEVRWEQEGWEAMMDTQRLLLGGSSPSPSRVVPPTPEESELIWYEHTKVQHPTLSAEDAWQLAVHNRSRARSPAPHAANSGEASGSASSEKSSNPVASGSASSSIEALEDWQYPAVPITVEQGIREHVRQRGASEEEASSIAAKYVNRAVSYGITGNHEAAGYLSSPVMQLLGHRSDREVPVGAGCSRCGRVLPHPSSRIWDIMLGRSRACVQVPLCQECTKPPWTGALSFLPQIPVPEKAALLPQPDPLSSSPSSPPKQPQAPPPSPPSEQSQALHHRRGMDQESSGPMRRPPGLDPERFDHAKLKELEAEDRLLSSLRKLRDRITIYTCPLDNSSEGKSPGHMLQPLKLLMRELQDYFKESQVVRALSKKKVCENKDSNDTATVTTVPEELRLIIRDRVTGSAQGLLNQKVQADQMKSLSDMIGTLARACVSDAHLSILPSMLSRVRQVTGRNSGRNARSFHHALMEAFELLELLHEHGITGPVSRATLPGIFLSGLSPDLHARVHKELMGKVDFTQVSDPVGWEAELLRQYVEQATLEERKDPTGLKINREQSPFPLAVLTECLDDLEPCVEQCNALPAATPPASVEGRQLPGSSTFTGCRKCKSKDHLARDCPQQHDIQKKAAWVKCIWDEAFETFENAGTQPELVEEMFAVVAQTRMPSFGEGEEPRASPSPSRRD